MPHLTLQYSNNITQQPNFKDFFSDLHITLLRSLFGIFLAISVYPADLPDNFIQIWQKVASDYQQGLEDNQIVGSSLMFIADGKVVGQSHYGYADLQNQRHVDEYTIYHWASITKTFTAIALMQMRDRNLLSLEDPILKYIPELRHVYNPFGEMDEIRLKHLLT